MYYKYGEYDRDNNGVYVTFATDEESFPIVETAVVAKGYSATGKIEKYLWPDTKGKLSCYFYLHPQEDLVDILEFMLDLEDD